jgi:hydroxypyruvate isomerase
MNAPASRRRFLTASAVAATAVPLLAPGTEVKPSPVDPAFRITKGRLKQTVMGWCFNPMKPLNLARHCREIGLRGIEGIDRSAYKGALALGLEISLVGSHGFSRGPCNPEFKAETVAKLTEAIVVAADIGSKKVITFTGMKFDGMDRDRAIADCLDAWKKVLPLAEEKGVTLCLEHLNSRDGTRPMLGHPGYFGDDVEFCVDLVKRIGSPRFKLLFDIYHVSIMNGDVIRRIRQHRDVIGHYHTAGNPGRSELDDTQEINYPPIIRAIIETGYADFIAQEFIPTWPDPILALRHGAMVCDV